MLCRVVGLQFGLQISQPVTGDDLIGTLARAADMIDPNKRLQILALVNSVGNILDEVLAAYVEVADKEGYNERTTSTPPSIWKARTRVRRLKSSVGAI
jgi:hypothetical protein